ncbi:TPR-like protein [Dacryopinax primogenitus]|uniref:TPR-like protein n=1 Tax=Dacryopinax primogenitus (strain DJM 731) TaxID=1858805 RepID=M5GEK5_DACPD|nr:TPR-like protein [Dacryopinax primogenitus]EJU05497.1 TPR-like protein [Dacryopinax primogenitus]
MGRDALEESLRRNGTASLGVAGLREVRLTRDEAAVQCTMGNLAAKGNQPEVAKQHYLRALSLNPWIWEAYEGLAYQSTFPELDNILAARRKVPNKRRALSDDPMDDIDEHALPPPAATGAGFFTPSTNGATAPPPPPPLFLNRNGRVMTTKVPIPKATGAAAGPSRLPTIPARQAEGRPPVLKKARSQTATAAPPARPTRSSTQDLRKGSSSRSTSVEAPLTRRSTRLASALRKPQQLAKKPPPPPLQQRTKRVPGRQVPKEPPARIDEVREPGGYSPSSHSAASPPVDAFAMRNTMWNVAEQIHQEQVDKEDADQWIDELVRIMAKAVRALTNYRCSECLDELDKLPESQERCAWVYCLIGRAKYEMTNYQSAERAFQMARLMDPHRQEDMEIYSTLLWHLSREVALSFLAQELVASNSRAPQAWVAVGNCFSLKKEHAHAQTCFRRAARCNPSFAYAYTLSGHEALATDETEKAMALFQTAVRTDQRHYNAWYGLGRAYLKQMKFRMAEYHFRKAVDLNPSNAVLVCCVGTVLEKRGQRENALTVYDAAHALAPTSAMVLFRRAKVQVELQRYQANPPFLPLSHAQRLTPVAQDALRDLVTLRDTVPEEANVAYTLGRVYLLLGDRIEATRTLAIAQDLEHKLGPAIKMLLEAGQEEGPGRGGEGLGGASAGGGSAGTATAGNGGERGGPDASVSMAEASTMDVEDVP